MNSQMATVKSTTGNLASIEIGNGEIKTARIPKNVSISIGDKVLVMLVSGKYLIINAY